MALEKRLALQQWQIREAVKQFPGCSVHELAARSMIPRAVFHRRLVELERGGYVAKGARGDYHPIPLEPDEFPDLEDQTTVTRSCNGTLSTR